MNSPYFSASLTRANRLTAMLTGNPIRPPTLTRLSESSAGLMIFFSGCSRALMAESAKWPYHLLFAIGRRDESSATDFTFINEHTNDLTAQWSVSANSN